MLLRNNDGRYPQVPNYDDEIVDLENVLFDVFYFGREYKHFLLKNNDQQRVNQQSLRVTDDKLFINGTKQTKKKIKLDKLIIKRHADVKTITTALPTHSVTVANNDKAAIKTTKKSYFNIIVKHHNYRIVLADNNNDVYFNNKKVKSLDTEFTIGSQLVVAGLVIERRPQQFKITEIDGSYSLNELLLPSENYQAEYPIDFPNFKRSPRIILAEPDEKIKVNQPRALSGAGKNDLLKTILPPVGMLSATFATSLLSGRNPLMMVGMGIASVITAGISISSYITNKKERVIEAQQREIEYKEYMVVTAAKLKQLYDKQLYGLNYHYPNMVELTELIVNYSHRIYEKTRNNADYLQFSLGTGDVPASYTIGMEYSENSKNDPLVTYAKENLVDTYQTLKNAPITISLQEQTLGLVGDYHSLQNAVQTMLLQIATFHSYHEVEMLLLIPEDNYEDDWQEWRWLPHFKMEELNLRGIVHNAQTRDMVLNSFYQLLNRRRQQVRENGNTYFGVHYILTILDESWLFGHGLNEFLAEDMSQYGVTVIWGKEDAAMLPETVTTLVEYNTKESAELVNENNVYLAKDFKPYQLPTNYDLSLLISRLANLNHLEVEKNAIPEGVTFLDMYDVTKIDELNIEQRWHKANTSKSLAVPLGLRGKDDLVYLNLHERAHGPHGLVAGTTGSGKSETVQSYLLSLAVNFAPEDVGFLPIDFKGGGMANLFANLPHLLGSITNLDGASSARALASIRAELQKRQRLFGEFGVNHINGYTKLYKAGKEITDLKEKQKYPTKPMPHLFLVSDEFAELKANEPEFMAELVSTARIGRSLGVHLILATQKPSGVVDDQIWSNSRFKLALKVQDVADSNEILKTPDAASIVEPGRAYLQVGNNEIYELFQSAWSGAEYDPNKSHEVKIDERMWLINDYGQAELLTEDLSDDDDIQEVAKEEKQTQLDAIVGNIAEIARETKAVLPDKPWLPPLAETIATPKIDYTVEWKAERDLAVPVALMDIPDQQAQKKLLFDFEQRKHTAIIGSPGYGKSTLLQTLVMNLARKNTPEQVQFNLLDFGTNGLLVLQKLPHVADLVRLAEDEKLLKMLNKISTEIELRKKEFQKVGVSNFAQFEQHQHTLPVIINVLDGYDALLEDKHREEVDLVLSQILREGTAVGIYLVVTANRANSMRASLMSNIETSMVLFMVKESELTDIIGRERLIQQEIVGRGQIKLDQVNAFQVYLPNNEIESLASLNELNKEIQIFNNQWTGTRPSEIPIVPVEYDFEYFAEKAQITNELLALGLNLSDTQPVGYNLKKHEYFVMSYVLEEQKAIQRATLFEQLQKINATKILIDFENEVEQTEIFDRVITDGNSYEDRMAVMAIMNKYLDAAKNNEVLKDAYILIADLESFVSNLQPDNEQLKLILTKAYKSGLHIIIQSMEGYIGKSFDIIVKMVRENATAGIVSARVNDTNLINDMGSTFEPELNDNEAYYFEAKGKKYSKIRMPGNN